MRDDLHIDELINGFIDGELSLRQQTELQRLLNHDEKIANRLTELRKCKMLLTSLPRAQAPYQSFEQIKEIIASKTKTAIETPPEPAVHKITNTPQPASSGSRHLLFRRVLSAAAMIALIAGLAAVVYSIIAPSGDTKHLIARHPNRSLVATDKALTADTQNLEPADFTARLELTTKNLIPVEAVINRAIIENGLSDFVTPAIRGDRKIYTFNCTTTAITSLIADIKNIWPRFDTTTLILDTDKSGSQATIKTISPDQLIALTKLDTYQQRHQLAKNYIDITPEKDTAIAEAPEPDFSLIPKPVLTSAEKPDKTKIEDTDQQKNINLVIVVTQKN